MNNARNAEQRKANYIFPIVVGLFSPLIATTIIRVSDVLADWYFLVLSIIYFFAALALAYRPTKSLRAQAVIIYLLLPIGSFLDATLDHFIYGSGRNLWGLEVIVLMILVPFLLFFGMVTGRTLANDKSW